MASLPAANELDPRDLETSEEIDLSEFPVADEYMIDSFWYDKAGRDPVDQAFILRMDEGHERTSRLEKIIKSYPRYGPKLYEKFALKGRVDLLRDLRKLGASMDIAEAQKVNEHGDDDIEDKHGVPKVTMDIPLLQASNKGHLDCVKFFVEDCGVDVNVEGERPGDTPLINAASGGHPQVVRWLLAHGARIQLEEAVNRKDDIYLAMTSGNVEVVKLLLESEQCKAQEFKFYPGLIIPAAYSGSPYALELALKYNRFPDASVHKSGSTVDPPGLTAEQEAIIREALPYAVSAASLEAVRLLLSYLCPRTVRGGFAPLQVDTPLAAQIFNATEDAMEKADNDTLFEVVWDTVLSPAADDPNATESADDVRYSQLNRRLISACSEGRPQTVKLLCERYGADVNHLSYMYSTTPLIRAVGTSENPFAGRFAAADYLLQHPGIDIHVGTGEFCNGPTALVSAVQEAFLGGRRKIHERVPMVKLLLEHGGPLENTNQGLVKHCQSLSPESKVKVFAVVFNDKARMPVQLMLEEEFRDIGEEHGEIMEAEMDLTAAEALSILVKVQIRRSDALLAANDVQHRSLRLTAYHP